MSTLPAADPAAWIHAVLEAVGPWGPVAVAALLVIGALAFLPRPAICVAAGFAYGNWAIPLALAGSIAGACLAFWIGRRLLRPRLSAFVDRRAGLRAVARAVEAEGFRGVLLLRLGPVIPSSMLTYLLSTTSVPFPVFATATALGIAPAICLQVMVGAATRAALEADLGGPLMALAAVGLASFAIALVLIGRRSRRLLAAGG
jgi:uncharacterized membrane protein YdjX (TVP38/TMEM64 family)